MKSVDQNDILIFLICALLGYLVARFLSGNGFSVGITACSPNTKCSGFTFGDPGLTYNCPDGTGPFENMKINDCNAPCITYCTDTDAADTTSPLGILGNRGQYCKRKKRTYTTSTP